MDCGRDHTDECPFRNWDDYGLPLGVDGCDCRVRDALFWNGRHLVKKNLMRIGKRGSMNQNTSDRATHDWEHAERFVEHGGDVFQLGNLVICLRGVIHFFFSVRAGRGGGGNIDALALQKDPQLSPLRV